MGIVERGVTLPGYPVLVVSEWHHNSEQAGLVLSKLLLRLTQVVHLADPVAECLLPFCPDVIGGPLHDQALLVHVANGLEVHRDSPMPTVFLKQDGVREVSPGRDGGDTYYRPKYVPYDDLHAATLHGKRVVLFTSVLGSDLLRQEFDYAVSDNGGKVVAFVALFDDRSAKERVMAVPLLPRHDRPD